MKKTIARFAAALLMMVGLSPMVLAEGQSTQESSWFPPEVQEGAARQLAAELAKIDFGEDHAEEVLLGDARNRITKVRERLDSWGMERVLEMAPSFPKVDLPKSADAQMNAIARYGVCSFYLDAMFNNPELDKQSPQIRYAATVGSTSIAVVSLYLRQHFLAAGGTDDDLKGFLAGEPMNKATLAIQQSSEVLSYTYDQCESTVNTLIEG